MHAYRSHYCGRPNRKEVGNSVRLSGWVHRKRDHGDLLFIDLRDHYGMTQLVSEVGFNGFAELEKLSLESVLTVTGMVTLRSDETINKDLPNGDIEVVIAEFEVQSLAETLPMPVNQDAHYPEDIRLRYRFLDLRRQSLHSNIELRNDVIAELRQQMWGRGFSEFQTPILTASSPEGARDFLVPSRLHAGKFYALPQAPQQFKQLLMVAGFDKYFQIAPCFRDEDARADRSPGEFYQLDFEMAFATQEDVFAAIEPVLTRVFEKFAPHKSVCQPPYRRIAYADALLAYGSDKPDLRNPIIIRDVSDIFGDSGFKIFAEAVARGSVVRAIAAPRAASRPRSFFDKLNDWARQQGQAGLGYVIFREGVGVGPIAKNLDAERLAKLRERTGLQDGDAVFFVCDEASAAAAFAGAVRTHVGTLLELIDENCFEFCWIVDFPMFEYDAVAQKIDFSHNPFCMPQGGLAALQNEAPLNILAYQYDIVCNGVELSSGAVRNHRPDIMYAAFAIAGYDSGAVDSRFGAMINAFKYGAPPHAGCAPGIDRIVMLLAGEMNLREVIAFPMNQMAEDLMMQAPATVSQAQLQEVHMRIELPPMAEEKS